MLSNKIYKHFFIELNKYFFIILFTFAAIVWTVQAVNLLDLIVEDGHAVSIYLKYSLLNISKVLTKFIPLSFLLALVITIRRLDEESELMILWTAGVNKIKLINFFIKFSLLITVLQLILAAFVNPNVLNYSRSLIKSSSLDFMSGTIKTNRFNDVTEGLTIFVEKKNESGKMENIFIRDESQMFKGLENSGDYNNLSIFAKKGYLLRKGKSFLVLEEGTIHSENNLKDKVQVIKFKKTQLLLEDMRTKSIVQPKIQETSSINLFRCLRERNVNKQILNCPKIKEKGSFIEILSEMNRRFGMPLYIPLIALLSSFLLLSRDESNFKNFNKYFYFGLSFATLLIAEILVRYSGKSYIYTLIYFFIPIVSAPIIYLELIRRFLYENLRKKS